MNCQLEDFIWSPQPSPQGAGAQTASTRFKTDGARRDCQRCMPIPRVPPREEWTIALLTRVLLRRGAGGCGMRGAVRVGQLKLMAICSGFPCVGWLSRVAEWGACTSVD